MYHKGICPVLFTVPNIPYIQKLTMVRGHSNSRYKQRNTSLSYNPKPKKLKKIKYIINQQYLKATGFLFSTAPLAMHGICRGQNQLQFLLFKILKRNKAYFLLFIFSPYSLGKLKEKKSYDYSHLLSYLFISRTANQGKKKVDIQTITTFLLGVNISPSRLFLYNNYEHVLNTELRQKHETQQRATYIPCPLPTLFLQTDLMCCARPILTTEASAFIAVNTLSNYCNSAGTSAPNSNYNIVISIS